MRQMELNQIHQVGVTRKEAEPMLLTLDLIGLIQEVLEVLEKMESNRRGLWTKALDVVGDWRLRLPGNCH